MRCILRSQLRKHSSVSLAEIEPQLIVNLSDINMPGMDGMALLREIKTRRPDLPVIMLTAYGDEERRRRAGEYGTAEFLTKPVDFDLLKERLRQLHEPSSSKSQVTFARFTCQPCEAPLGPRTVRSIASRASRRH